jgi:hypothetical protein
MLIVQVHFRAGGRKSHRRQRLQTGPRRREVEQDAEDSVETAIERLYHLVYRTIKRAATGPMLRCSRKANTFATSAPRQGASMSWASAIAKGASGASLLSARLQNTTLGRDPGVQSGCRVATTAPAFCSVRPTVAGPRHVLLPSYARL